MLTVYSNPFSQHCRRVLALLEIAKIKYETEFVDLAKGEHRSPDFLAMNPNHQVPVLVDGDLALFESHAILRYLCGRFSLTDWYPENIVTRSIVDQWLDWNQCRLSPAVVNIVLNKVFLGEDGDPQAIARGETDLVDLGDLLAKRLWEHSWLAGDAPSIADISVASNITQLDLAGAVPDHPPIRRWYARVCAIDGFRKTLPPPLEAAA